MLAGRFGRHRSIGTTFADRSVGLLIGLILLRNVAIETLLAPRFDGLLTELVALIATAIVLHASTLLTMR